MAEPGGKGGDTAYGSQTGSAGYNTALQNDKAFQLAQLLKILGLGSADAQHSYLGGQMARTYGQLFPAWMETQGLGGENITDNMTGLMGDFKNKVQSPGGFGAMAGDANKAISQLIGNTGMTTNLDDAAIMGQLLGFKQLAGAGLNPLLAQSQQNGVQQSLQDFLASFDSKSDPTARYLPFIQKDPRYKWITGGGQ